MSHQGKVFAAKPDNWSSILETHMLEETDSYKLSSDLHMCTMTCRCLPKDMQTTQISFLFNFVPNPKIKVNLVYQRVNLVNGN